MDFEHHRADLLSLSLAPWVCLEKSSYAGVCQVGRERCGDMPGAGQGDPGEECKLEMSKLHIVGPIP